MTTITFRVFGSISQVESLWTELDRQAAVLKTETGGAFNPLSHTFYQTFGWNAFVERSVQGIKRLTKQPEYIVAFRDEKPVAIVPLLVSRFSGKVEFPSWRVAGTNNMVILPGTDDDGSVARAVVEFMRERYRGRRFRFFDVPDISSFGAALAQLSDVKITARESFHLPLSGFAGFDEYKSTLSKSLCQTIRTGRNHLNRCSGWRFWVCGKDDMPSDEYMASIWRLYFARKNSWNNRNKYLYNGLVLAFDALRMKNGIANRSLRELSEARLSVLEIEGRPAAFAIFYLCGRNITVPKLAIDNAFKHYSPGLVMLDELVKWSFDNSVSDFDLSRGSEPYKQRMGCVAEPISRFSGRF